ncbi:MAG: hypothetical protein ACLPN2_19025 [Terriglobales bacterium]
MLFFFFALASLSPAQATKEEGASQQESPEKSTGTPAQGAKERAGTGEKAAGPTTNAPFPLDAFKNFSAVMVGDMNGSDDESNIYRRGNLMRTEVGVNGYMITDLEKGDTYGIAKTGCLHDSHPGYRVFPFRAAKHGTVQRVASGKETLDGHSCVIEDVSITTAGPGGGGFKFRFWEAEDLQGFPIKIEFLRPKGRVITIEYKNVVLAPPDAALFKHPLHCQSLADGEESPKRSVPAKAPSATTPPVATPPGGALQR